MFQRATDYLEERLQLPTLWRNFTDRNLPAGIGWVHMLGSATLFLLLVQVATGIFLAFYYVPSPEHAYMSVKAISTELSFGWLVRGMHRWAASLVIIFMLLHMLRVFYMGAFKYPRELTWVVGVLLLLVVLAFGFTGYLLPWDQRAYWATVVGTHIAGFAPGVGQYVTEILRGEPEVGVRTLGRFYAFHTLFLPGILFSLIAVHLTMVIKQGIAPLPVKNFASALREQYWSLYESFKKRGQPFFHSMAKDTAVAFAVLLLLFYLAWEFGAPLEAEADPTSAMYVPRPEWYFFFLFELLWWFPGRWIAVATFWIPLALMVLLIMVPWLDRSVHRAPLRRPVPSALASAILAMAAFLTYKGAIAPTPSTLIAVARTRLETEALSPSAQEGKRVYEEQACAACHTIEGVGGSAGPSLSAIGARQSSEWLKQLITNPASIRANSEMPPFDSLSPEELDALVAYLQTLQ